MSAHQVDLVGGADNVSEDDDDKTVSVHGDEQPPIDVDELNMKPQARKKNPGSESNSLVSNFQRNQRAKDEREMCELRARQAERYKREEDKLSNAGEGKANLGNEDGSESGSDNEMVYGNWLEKENEKVRIKIEGEERKPQNDAKLVHKSQVTKPRHRGAVVGNGSTMRLEEGQKVSKKWRVEIMASRVIGLDRLPTSSFLLSSPNIGRFTRRPKGKGGGMKVADNKLEGGF